MKTILWTVSLLLVICGCTPKPTEVVSPDGHIRLQFALDDHNRMTYRIDVDDTAFVAPSALGFLAGEGVNLSEGMKVVGTEFSAADETWTQPWGENKSIRNHYNEMAVCLSDEADTKLTLRFRADFGMVCILRIRLLSGLSGYGRICIGRSLVQESRSAF